MPSIKVNPSFTKMVAALRYGKGLVRILAALAGICLAFSFVALPMQLFFHLPGFIRNAGQFAAVLGFMITAVATTIQRVDEIYRNRLKIEVAEKRVEENPNKPQLAWELAQVKLESYLTRNLSQVRSIFFLTVFVMLVGFTLIGVGAYKAFADVHNLNASVLSAVSGVLVSFIGGTFLVLYKATMAQAKDYVTILERINAVGMSVQILESLDDDLILKRESTAEVAKLLLHMYSTNIPGAERKTKKRAANRQTQ
jgi:hypothetical protein